MSTREEELRLRLAGQIADRASIDWEAELEAHQEERELLLRLRRVEQFARAFGSQEATLFETLRELAGSLMATLPPGAALHPTTLVRKAYALLAGREGASGSRDFFPAAAEGVRRLVVEQARRQAPADGTVRQSPGAGGTELRIEPPTGDVLLLDEALERLKACDPSKADVVLLRAFAGLTIAETAQVLALPQASAERAWRFARAFLYDDVTWEARRGPRMHAEQWAQAESLFQVLLDRSPAERAQHLTEKGDPELRVLVERLLSHHDGGMGSFLEPPEQGALEGSAASPELSMPTPAGAALGQVGPYRLLQVVAEGGMGVVYKAEQERPIRRTVALKMIRLGMSSREVMARFATERQALALMKHPNIAPVHDAGAASDGRPYFVMEYVPGRPITDYCDQEKLSLRERLALFMPVLQAIQHAHQKGIVHRDLKPSNVLVMVEGNQPVAKVIDFGIAKAMTRGLTDQTLETQVGEIVGTPEYMSPEQAGLGELDIDTRTDVYSLGVLLYELLVGALPFEPSSRAGREELLRRIREEEPPKPSTRLRTFGDKSAAAAERRRLDLPALRRQLAGDLDCITMRALEKDRTRRYGSPSELVADLERYLKHEPVLAGPPSATYRLRKFVRRHRVGVLAGATVAVAVLAGVAGLTWGLVRALRSEARARQSEASARDEAEVSQRVTDFLVGLFEVSDPSRSQGKAISARELLDRGAEKIKESGELAEQPIVRARLLITLGMVYRSLALPDHALPLLEEGVRAVEAALGPEHPTVASYTRDLAWANFTAGELETAQRLAERALGIYEKAHSADPGAAGADQEALDIAMSLRLLGDIQFARGEVQSACRVCEKALTIREGLGFEHERSLGPYLRSLGPYLHSYGVALLAMAEFDKARTILERALSVREKWEGTDNITITYSLSQLGNLCVQTADYDEARRYLERSRTIRERVLPADHFHVAWVLNDLALLSMATGDTARARQLFERSLAVFEASGHRDVSNCLANFAELLIARGELEAAQTMILRAQSIMEDWLGADNYEFAQVLGTLGRLRMRQGRLEEAETFFNRALAIRRQKLGSDHPEVAETLHQLAVLYRELGRFDAAEQLLEQAIEIRRQKFRPDHPKLIESVELLARLRRGRHAEQSATSE